MNIENVPVANIKPYERNAKKHPAEQVEHIANSIREFGFKQPLVIDKDNVLVIGHGRLLAAQKIGMETVPCVRADDLTEEQIKALRLADNKTNESDWDYLALDLELDELNLDMEQFGFEHIDYDAAFMDSMMDEFGTGGEAIPRGAVTINFDTPEEAEEVKSYIRKNGDEGVIDSVLNFVRGL